MRLIWDQPLHYSLAINVNNPLFVAHHNSVQNLFISVPIQQDKASFNARSADQSYHFSRFLILPIGCKWANILGMLTSNHAANSLVAWYLGSFFKSTFPKRLKQKRISHIFSKHSIDITSCFCCEVQLARRNSYS